jgi:glycosyltransferase involved in cell wall biosynthesis
VVPTLFEGGFPFPFSESLSVGTPVVMSDISVTREVVPPDLQPVMLFDPYDVEAIADRIAWALDHRSVLLARQRPFHAALQRRTWHDVAGEYRATLITAAGDSSRAPEGSRRTNSARE